MIRDTGNCGSTEREVRFLYMKGKVYRNWLTRAWVDNTPPRLFKHLKSLNNEHTWIFYDLVLILGEIYYIILQYIIKSVSLVAALLVSY